MCEGGLSLLDVQESCLVVDLSEQGSGKKSNVCRWGFIGTADWNFRRVA